MHRWQALVGAHPLPAFFALAYAISWALWLPRVGTEQGWWDSPTATWWHYLGAAGPITAAAVVTVTLDGRAGLGRLAGQYRVRRDRVGWLAFAVVSPLVLLGLGVLAVRLLDEEWTVDLGHTANLPDLGLPLTMPVHLASFAIGEETGWRGFALPRLQAHRPALRAAQLLAIWWGLWHLPAFFENPSLFDMSAFQIVGWALGLFMASIFFAWLYNSSGGLLAVVIWHGLFNTFAAAEGPDTLPAVMTVGVIGMAVVAIRLAGPQRLTGLSRQRKDVSVQAR